MTVGTLTLAEFILARIAEDEAVWQEAMKWTDRDWNAFHTDGRESFVHADHADPILSTFFDGRAGRAIAEHIARWDPARARAATTADRRTVELHAADGNACLICIEDMYPCDTLKFRALPYADHPDYRDEWKP